MSQLSRFRVSLVHAEGVDEHKCHKCVVDCVVVVQPDHQLIAQVAVNKLRKLKTKDLGRVRLVLKHAVNDHAAGCELPVEGDLSEYLANGAVLAVSVRKSDTKERRQPAAAREARRESPDAEARAWGDAARARASFLDAPLLSAHAIISKPDVLYLLAAHLGLRHFLMLSGICRGWHDTARSGDDFGGLPIDEWRSEAVRWSPLRPALKTPAITWSGSVL